MHHSVDPSARAPMRRVSILALVFVAAILSCGKDVTGPVGAAVRYARGLAFDPIFPPAFQVTGGSGVVQFSKVHVVLHHDDGSVALDTTIDFPDGQDSLTVDLTVKLLDNAPSTGEPMSLNLGYLNASGDVVFTGGPVSVTAAPPAVSGQPNPPVKVPVVYTGPGATAVSVAISPRTQNVNAGGTFSFTAIAKDGSGNAIAAPIIWNSLDPAIASIASAAAGSGVAASARGTARIIAQLFSGGADTVLVNVLLPAANLVVNAGGGQFGVVGTNLANPLVVKVAASDGVGVAGTTVNFAVATGGGSVGNATAVSDINGLAQTTFKLGPSTGAQTVTATAAGLNNSPATFTDTALAATAAKLVVTTQPVNGLGGAALTPFAVTAEDNNGNIATTFTGAVTIAFGANTAGGTLSGTLTANAALGVATFSAAKINKIGSAYTLVASATGLTSGTTNAFDINVGPAATLALSGGDAQTGTTNASLTLPVVVRVTDLGGNSVSGTTVTFATASGSVTPTTAASNATGLASTTWTLGASVGAQTMTASATGLAGSPITINATATSAVAGPAASLSFSTNPSNAVAGVANSPAIVVRALDAGSLLATTFTGNVTLAIGTNPGASTLGGTITVAAVAGVATFPNITLNHSGTGYTLVASSGVLAAGTSGTFNITNAAASNFAITAGNGQTATISTALVTPLAVTVTDPFGNVVAGQSVSFAIATGGGSLGTTVAVTDAAGQATSVWTLGALVGAQTVTATSAGLTGSPATFTATGTNVVGGPAVSLTFTTSPSNAVAGVANSPAIVVRALDASSLLATTFTGNVTLTIGTNPGASALSGGLVVAAVGGIATFPNVSLNHTGVGYTLIASSGVLTPGTSSTFNITSAAAANFAITGGQAQTGTISSALPTPLTVKATDAFGNAVAGTNVGFSITTGGGSLGTTSAVTDVAGQAASIWTLGPTIGAQTVTATSAGLTGSPAIFAATGTVSSVRTWTGATSTAWLTTTNWAPVGVPVSTDSVIIPLVTNQPTIASATTIKALAIQSGALLTFGCSTMTINGSLDATGGIAGCGGVVLTSATAATMKGIVSTPIQVQGVYTLNGTLTANSLQMLSGSLDMNGNVAAIGLGGVSTAGTATIKFTNVGSTMVTTGGASFGGGSETGKLTAGSLTVASNFSEGGGATDAYNASATFATVLNGTVAQSFSFADPNISQFGQLNINNAAGITALTAFQAGSVQFSAGTLTGALGGTLNGPLVDPLGGLHLSSIAFAGNATPVSVATPVLNVTGSVTFNNNPSNLAANLTINGAVNVLGTLVVSGHTLTVNGAFTTSASGQLTMNNAADVVNVTGNVAFSSAGGVGGPMIAGTMHIGGNFFQSGNSSSIATGGTNTIDFNGAGTQTITFSSPDGNYAAGCSSASCFQNVTVNKTGGQLNILTDVKVQGSFTNSSTFPIVTPVSNGPLIIAGNAAYGQNMTIHRTGVGGATFTKGAGTAIDSVSYFGAGQTYNPATLGEGYSDIRGTAQWSAGGTLTGQMVLSGAGALNVSTSHAIVTGDFTENGTSTLAITTNPLDSLMIGGDAVFQGGASTGLLTTGNLVVTGNITVLGAAIDGSGAFMTTLNGTAGTQTLSWVSPIAGKGYNHLTLRGAAQRQFSGNQTVVGNMLIAANSGNVNGSFVLTFGGNMTDSTLLQNAWNGSSSVVFTAAPSVLPKRFGVNNITFKAGTVTLADTLMGFGSLTVDGATSHLKLNGHYLAMTSNFTTQNGGVFEMTNTHDTLVVNGTSTFNGGNTSTLLTHGYMNIASFIQGVNATAFVADSTLRTSIGQGTGTSITFANPGFGPTLSHFGELMMGDGSTHSFNSNVFVQGQITTVSGPQFPITSSNLLITAQGANATNLFLTNTRLLLVDGSAISTLTNLKFLLMDPTVTQFEVQRSGTAISGDFAATLNAPIFNTTPTSGLYLKATDTNGSAPFLTINVSTPTPAASGNFTNVVSGAIINGWPSAVTITSAASGAWSNPATWVGGVVPAGPSNNAVISSLNVVTVSAPTTIGNLTINGSGTLTLTTTNTLTVSGTATNNGATTCPNDNIVLTGTISLTGNWCGIRSSGTTVTLSGTTNVTSLLNIAAGTLDVGGQTLNAFKLSTSGTGALKMTNASDLDDVNVADSTTFGGAAETGLLTHGTLEVEGLFNGGNGSTFVASGTHITQFGGTVAQSIGWTTPVAGIGFNNVRFNHDQNRTFTSNVYIGGSVTIFSSDTSHTISTAANDTVTIAGSGVSDGSVSQSAWQANTNYSGNPTLLPFTSGDARFSGAGTVTLASDVTMGNVVVDNSSNLNLAGHTLNLGTHNFTTQNSGTLQMSNFTDSLAAGHAYFNGGNTTAKLLSGGMAIGGLNQGFDASYSPVASSTTAFAPAAGLHTYFTGTDTVAFANPGTGATGSHFWYLHNNTASPLVLKTNIAVDSLMQGDGTTSASFNTDALSVTPRVITTKGIQNSGAQPMTFEGVSMVLNDGPNLSISFNNVVWNSFPSSDPFLVLFTQNRTSNGTSLSNHNYSALTFASTGFFVSNTGTANLTLGTGNTGAPCNSLSLGGGGATCK
jgi:hypothetical protein